MSPPSDSELQLSLSEWGQHNGSAQASVDSAWFLDNMDFNSRQGFKLVLVNSNCTALSKYTMIQKNMLNYENEFLKTACSGWIVASHHAQIFSGKTDIFLYILTTRLKVEKLHNIKMSFIFPLLYDHV